MEAAVGPLTHCHLLLALLSFAYVFAHLARTLLLASSVAQFQIPVHAFICSAGKRILGSADCVLCCPALNTHRSTEVAHVPAAIRPVALAMLVLALLELVGDMPTAVKPYFCVGLTPVMATLLALVFRLHMVSLLFAFLAPARSLSCCLTVVRVWADEESTPMSLPVLATFMGILSLSRTLEMQQAVLVQGTTTPLLDISMRRFSMTGLKSTAYLTTRPTSWASVLATARLDISSTCCRW